MKRTLGEIRQRIREELRAEGPDGAGFSSTFIDSNVRSALDSLAGIYTIRDIVSFTTTTDTNEYFLDDKIDSEIIENIIRVEYDDTPLEFKHPDSVRYDTLTESDKVNGWAIWGSRFFLFGTVEADKSVKLWITRAPEPPVNDDDEIEMPYYADEAIIQFVIAACYRESKDYEPAMIHYNIYQRARAEVQERAIPQGQRAQAPSVRAEYFPAVKNQYGYDYRSDTNPGGYPE